MSTSQSLPPSVEYQSRFRKWDEASWVRSKPHRLTPFDSALYFFSRQVTPVFVHDEVQAATDEVHRKILILQLFNYLEFTVWLEMGPVNEVCELIRRPDFLPWLPSEMKTDALKIYVDEGGHAEMSHSLIVAVEQHSGIRSLKLRPAFLSTLDELARSEEVEFTPLIKLFFTIISETLITGTLTDLPKDESVQRAVRDLAADHATDEGRHHAFFRQTFEYVWPRLPSNIQKRILVMLPRMLLAFLRPDAGAIRALLQQFPEVFKDPGRLTSEIESHPRTIAGIRKSAQPTLSILQDNGIFKEPDAIDAFQTAQLLPDNL